jgi:hypothetical protein
MSKLVRALGALDEIQHRIEITSKDVHNSQIWDERPAFPVKDAKTYQEWIDDAFKAARQAIYELA